MIQGYFTDTLFSFFLLVILYSVFGRRIYLKNGLFWVFFFSLLNDTSLPAGTLTDIFIVLFLNQMIT